MASFLSFVSAIVPTKNEELHIAECLGSILANDYPKEKLEVLVVDGMSRDKTREIVKQYNVRLIDNPKVTTPAAMNVGIQNAKGDIIIKMDAHSVYAKDYISKCVRHLEESGADNVGGVLKSTPARDTFMAKAIAFCLSHVFGAGGSHFRTGVQEPMEVDTVAFGCWRKETFDKIGLFNEEMAQIEDLEFNYRLRKAGGKIMLFPDIQASYYPSSTTLGGFFKHNFTDGIWATYPLKFGFVSSSPRHYIPLIFVLTLPLGIWLYIPISLFFSLKIAIMENNIGLFFAMPLAFAVRHVGYGLGSVFGVAKILL